MNSHTEKAESTPLRQLLRGLTSEGALRARAARETCLAFDPVDERYVWITDAGFRIGLIDRKECTLEWVAPHPGRPSARPAEIPAVYHAPTYQGGRIIAQWWVTARGSHRYLPGAPWRMPWEAQPGRNEDKNFKKTKPSCTWTFGAESGEMLTFRIDETFALPGAPAGSHRFTIGYDPLADSYVADVQADLSLQGPYAIEFCNFYAGGVYDNRPRKKRYQHTLWAHPDGRFVRWPHHPAGYMTPGMNDPEGERRIARGGFIGYFWDPFSNPVVELVETTFPVAAATCCNIYDEHLLLVQPAGDADTDRYRAQFRFYSIPAEAAASISERAELIRFGEDSARPNPVMTDPEVHPNDLSRRLNYRPQYPMFYFNQVNDLEAAAPLDRTVAGSFLFVSTHPDHAIHWEDDQGHSGRRSIRLRGDGPGKTVETALQGPTTHLDGGKAYRLSGWIRCRGVTGEARIRFREIGMRSRDTTTTHIAGPLSGDCDWTYVEACFTTLPGTQFGWLHLDLEGSGQAWFDDLALEEG